MKLYFWRDGDLHMQFKVLDLDRAWSCAKDVPHFLTQFARGAEFVGPGERDWRSNDMKRATVTQLMGDGPGIGSKYRVKQLKRGKCCYDTVYEGVYEVKEINEETRTLVFWVEGCIYSNEISEWKFDLRVQVGKSIIKKDQRFIRPIVTVTTSQQRPSHCKNACFYSAALYFTGCSFVLAPCFLGCMYYRRDQKEVSGIAHRLQFHFNYYEPQEKEFIPMAQEDGGKGAIEPAPVAQISREAQIVPMAQATRAAPQRSAPVQGPSAEELKLEALANLGNFLGALGDLRNINRV